MKVTCPKCGSDQITSAKKGFSGKNAVIGGVLTGGIGLLAGTIGSNKVVCTCIACGNAFKAGEGKIVYEPGEAPIEKPQTPVNQNSDSGGGTIAIVLWLWL